MNLYDSNQNCGVGSKKSKVVGIGSNPADPFHSASTASKWISAGCRRGVIGTRINFGPCTLRFRREQLRILPPLVEICDQSYWFTRENSKKINQKWELLGKKPIWENLLNFFSNLTTDSDSLRTVEIMHRIHFIRAEINFDRIGRTVALVVKLFLSNWGDTKTWFHWLPAHRAPSGMLPACWKNNRLGKSVVQIYTKNSHQKWLLKMVIHQNWLVPALVKNYLFISISSLETKHYYKKIFWSVLDNSFSYRGFLIVQL